MGRTPELWKGGNRVKLLEKQEEPAVLLAKRKRSHEAAINTLRHLHLTSTYVPTRQKQAGCASLHETPTCLAYSAQFLRVLTCGTIESLFFLPSLLWLLLGVHTTKLDIS